MYPQPELNRLALHKFALQQRIATQRVEYSATVAQVTRPLAWLDRLRGFLERCAPLVPFAVFPLGMAVQRTFFPRFKILGATLRWGPMVYGALRGARARARQTSP
jgi:hypothetical protein